MAKTSTFQDSFDTSGISGNWSTSLSADATQVTNPGGCIEISHTATIQYNALDTASTYDLTNDSMYIQLVNAGNQTIASHEAIFQVYLNSTNHAWFTASNGNLAAFTLISGTQTQIGSSVTYSNFSHRWLRLRESGGTLYWDVSFNGSNWTNLWSAADPFTLTAINPTIQSGCYNNEASGSFAIFDDFNTNESTSNIIRPMFYDRTGGSLSMGIASN